MNQALEDPILKQLESLLGSSKWKGLPISEENRGVIRAFEEECRGIRPSSRLHYVKELRAVAALLGKPFREATKRDIKRVVWDYARGRRVKTVNNFKVAVKRFYQWLYEMDDDYPEVVKWMKPTPTKNRIKPEQLVTEEEFRLILRACNNQRDRTILQLFREVALKPHELLGLRVGDVRPTKYGVLITVDGKTGTRKIPIIDSAPDLRSWLNMHASRDEPEAPLFYAFKKGGEVPLKYEGLKSLFRRLKRATGIKRRIYPYLLRHTSLTEDAKKLKEPILREKAGWVPGSRMPAVYLDLAGRLEEELEEEQLEREPRRCPRCRAQNPFDAKYCTQCGTDLERGGVEEEKRELREEIEALKRETAEIKEILKKLVEETTWQQHPRKS